jgi:isopentenyl-diphosphate delta-isomerase
MTESDKQSNMSELILVDSFDNEIGHDTKQGCHFREPKLHRALSVFVINDAGEMLITRRSELKKTWPLYWSNACCSHPPKGQDCPSAAANRLYEELGVRAPVRFLFKFEYRAQYNEEWGEHELDWVFLCRHNGPFLANPAEIVETRFVSILQLRSELQNDPAKFTPWFHLCVERVVELCLKSPV